MKPRVKKLILFVCLSIFMMSSFAVLKPIQKPLNVVTPTQSFFANCLVRKYKVVSKDNDGFVSYLKLGREYSLENINDYRDTRLNIEPKRTKQCPGCENLHCISYDPADCEHSNNTTCAWNPVLLKCVTVRCTI